MEYFNEINNKYMNICHKYGVYVKIKNIDDSNMPKQQIVENEIILNNQKIIKEDYEMYLSYNIRKLLIPQLRLITERLIIRRYEYKDADDLYEFCSDKDSCYMDGGYEPYLEKNEDYYNAIHTFKDDGMRFIIALKETNEAIGIIHLMPCDDRVVECLEIGYTMNPSKRRSGYGYEAINKMINVLIDELNLDLLIAGVYEENIPSIKMMEKLGFTCEGKRRKSFYYPSKGASDILMYYKEKR